MTVHTPTVLTINHNQTFYPLQRVQNVCAGYIYGLFATEGDYLCLEWLPVTERRILHLLNTTFKALYFEYWPVYVKLKTHVPGRTLRSSN